MNSKNKILIINSLGIEARRYMDSLSDMLSLNFDISIKPANCNENPAPSSQKEPNCKIYLGPILNFEKNDNKLKSFIFLLILPFLFFYNFTVLYGLRRQHRIDKLFLTNWNEKIVLTSSANLLRIKPFWLEPKCLNKKIFSSWPAKPIRWLYKINASQAKIITASNFIREQLINWMIDKNRIFILGPAIKMNSVEHQENIFESMAKKDYLKKQRKFFTIGVVCRLDENQKIEWVFSAVNLCLETIPNLQLIVVGEGREKKNLTWLAKKIHVENMVWFVGGQDRPKKWLDNFDIFILPLTQVKIPDYYSVLEAMSAGLPVIAPKNFGLEDMIGENRTGTLIEFDNPEMLSQQILKLEQNIGWRHELGKNAKEKIASDFTLDKMSSKLNEIINF
jgi:glycosyltransferase involved in cell wall biosynthesis